MLHDTEPCVFSWWGSKALAYLTFSLSFAGLRRPLAELLVVVAPDEAQLGPQTLAVAQQAALLLQQPAVLLEAPGRRLLLALLQLQLAGQILSEGSQQLGQRRTHALTHARVRRAGT